MRFFIDFGTQYNSKIDRKSVRNFRFSRLGVSSAFLRSRVASCHLFCIVGCSANLGFSWKNRAFLKVFPFGDRSCANDVASRFHLPRPRKINFKLSKIHSLTFQKTASKIQSILDRFLDPKLFQNGGQNRQKIVQEGCHSLARPSFQTESSVFQQKIGPRFDFGRSEVDFTPTGSASGPSLDPLWHRFWNPGSILGPIFESAVHFGSTLAPILEPRVHFGIDVDILNPIFIPLVHVGLDFGSLGGIFETILLR